MMIGVKIWTTSCEFKMEMVSLKWKHPPKRDLLNLNLDSILDCKVDDEWDVSKKRSINFSLRSHVQVDLKVEQMSFR